LYLSSITGVDLSSDEAQISRLVASVDFFSVELKLWVVPPVEGDEVLQEGASVCSPGLVYVDAALAVVGVAAVVGVVTPVKAGRNSVEKPSSVAVIRNDVGISEVAFDPATALPLGAGAARLRPPGSEVGDVGLVFRGPAIAAYNDVPYASGGPKQVSQ
jgi:hypothetical protein